ncbi:MAG: transposase [Pseudomonadales bacterium]|nr:transposase [Pseudomonadales bacterium]MDP6473174.1 transposase [Pseudomonadales bacterium]MDP6826068.1 transposase [Pseudomonadales bacterium]MDP6971404.1 transposase [Pseudomonadales bacterium]
MAARLVQAEVRDAQVLSGFYDTLTEVQCGRIEEVAMDMWLAYIRATEDALPDTQIVFDKFHIAKHLGDALGSGLLMVLPLHKSAHRDTLQLETKCGFEQ